MIYSVLFFVLTVRAIVRSVQERFRFGIVAGGIRLVLALAGAVLAFQQSATIFLPGLTLRTQGGADSLLGALGTLLAAIGGPLVSSALLYVSWRRFHDVPAAEEARLGRPFDAWLPVGILDAVSVVVMIGAALLASTT